MTTINSARRAFFRGHVVDVAHHVPWAVEDFETACQRCDDCINVCEEAVLKTGDGGFPTIDFSRGACTFCGACASACRYGALDAGRSPAWTLKARLTGNCVSASGVTCRSCGDTCDTSAIRFRLQVGGRATPQFEEAACTGCGACIAICPTAALSIREEAV